MKEYNQPEENHENSHAGEPAVPYERQQSPSMQEYIPDSSQSLSQEEIEVMRKSVRRGMQQIKEGQFLTDEELDDFIFS
ncbi:MAG: hypothetical protein LUG98_01005 [Tannerellaceae bacterium]|nr:hypothetical protein [Tannerellaceae bacterium]